MYTHKSLKCQAEIISVAMERFRQHERTRRPQGDVDFIILHPQKPVPKKRNITAVPTLIFEDAVT